jgi:hypothetical protein
MSSKRARPTARPVRKPVSRTPVWVAPAAVLVVVALVVAAFLIYRWYTTPLPLASPSPNTTASLVAQITSLQASEFETVGAGSANNRLQKVTGTPLTGATGKPQVFYVGGEFCPFCAAQRWPLIIALSRFGTFSGLDATSSSETDIYPNTPTFTFRKATYTSQYIDFRGLETSDRQQQPLQTPSAAEDAVWLKYDPQRTIPFIDFGNEYVASGAMYSPDVLGGQSWQAIADALKDPTSVEAKAVLGSANWLTAAICKMTKDQPASVCSSATIQDLEKKLG